MIKFIKGLFESEQTEWDKKLNILIDKAEVIKYGKEELQFTISYDSYVVVGAGYSIGELMKVNGDIFTPSLQKDVSRSTLLKLHNLHKYHSKQFEISKEELRQEKIKLALMRIK